MSLSEKFQITVPYSEKNLSPEDLDEGNWTSFESARNTHGVQTPEHGAKFNRIAVTNIEQNGFTGEFRQGYGGNLDESGKVLFKDMEKTAHIGFTRLDMKATDDQYSGEHVDLYYGSVVDEFGQESFVERNNMLDRL